jgi:hypothetical protein
MVDGLVRFSIERLFLAVVNNLGKAPFFPDFVGETAKERTGIHDVFSTLPHRVVCG